MKLDIRQILNWTKYVLVFHLVSLMAFLVFLLNGIAVNYHGNSIDFITGFLILLYLIGAFAIHPILGIVLLYLTYYFASMPLTVIVMKAIPFTTVQMLILSPFIFYYYIIELLPLSLIASIVGNYLGEETIKPFRDKINLLLKKVMKL